MQFGTVLISNTTTSFIAQYDNQGHCLWSKFGEFPNGGSDPYGLACDRQGNIYVSGGDGDSVSTKHNFGFIVKYNKNGLLLSRKTIPHIPDFLLVDNRGNITVTGAYGAAYPIFIDGKEYQADYQTNLRPHFLIQYDSTGNLHWYKTITGDIGNIVMDEDKENNTYLACSSSSLHVDSLNYNTGGLALIKIAVNGTILWAEHTISSLALYPGAIYVNSKDEVFITGALSGTSTFGEFSLNQKSSYTDLFVAKSSQSTLTSVSANTSEEEFTIYPNPSNRNFTLSYQSEKRADLQIIASDAYGKVIFTENQPQFSGRNSKTFDLSSQPNGVYFIEVIKGDQRGTKRIVFN